MWLQKEIFAYKNEFIIHEYIGFIYLDNNFWVKMCSSMLSKTIV